MAPEQRALLHELIDQWPAMERKVRFARRAMEEGHYYHFLVDDYEEICRERQALKEAIDAALRTEGQE